MTKYVEYAEADLYTALAVARSEFQPVVANQTNPHFRNRYADLEAVLSAVEPALAAHDLLLIQAVQTDDQGAKLDTVLVHIPTGASISSSYPLVVGDNPQQSASSLTYARRYAITTLLGLVVDKDDDGNHASGRTPALNSQVQAAPSPEPVATPDGWDSDEQAQAAHAKLIERIGSLGEDHIAECRKFRAEHGWPLSVAKFTELENVVRAAEALGGEA